jgi:hypothetical protein
MKKMSMCVDIWNVDILLTMSHNNDNAIAFAVILNKNEDFHN